MRVASEMTTVAVTRRGKREERREKRVELVAGALAGRPSF